MIENSKTMDRHSSSSRRRFLQTLGASAPALLLSQSCGRSNRSRSHPPLMVLLVIDTLRTDNLSAYGYSRDTTPALRTFGQTADVYDWCVAPSSWTLPTMLSLFTGAPARVIVREVEQAETVDMSRPDRLTLAENLRKKGITSAGFVTNPIVSGHPFLPLGFKLFETEYVRDDEGESKLKRKDAVNVFRDAAQYLRAASFPLFLYLHLMDTHEPLNPDYVWDPEGKAGDLYEFLKNQYDGCIRHVDKQIGIFFETLKGFGFWDDIMIVATADHGEHLGKRRRIRGHGKSVYEELIRVPLFIKHPGQNKGKRIQQMTDLRFVYHLLNDPERASNSYQSESVILSETLHNLPGHERNDTYESISASQKDGLKLISYFDTSPDYRPLELFQSPEPGRKADDILGRWRLAAYEKISSDKQSSIYRCNIIEREKKDSQLLLKSLRDFQFTVPIHSDPSWNTMTEVNNTPDMNDKNRLVFFGPLADHLYQETRSKTKWEHIKMETIHLLDFGIDWRNERTVYKYIVEYTFLASTIPFPEDTDRLGEFSLKRITNRIILQSYEPLFYLYNIVGGGFHPASHFCYTAGKEDMRYAEFVGNTPLGQEFFESQNISIQIKQIFIRQEEYAESETDQIRYGVYCLAELHEDKETPTNQEEASSSLNYIDTGVYGEIPLLIKSCRFFIPRYLKEYYHSLDMKLLEELIRDQATNNKQSVGGFSIMSVEWDPVSRIWKYIVNVLFADGPVFPFSWKNYQSSAANMRFSMMTVQSKMPLIGNVDGLDHGQSDWMRPAQKEINRKRVVTALNGELQKSLIATLDPERSRAVKELAQRIDTYLEETGEVGNPLDQLEGVSDETLRALGYIN